MRSFAAAAAAAALLLFATASRAEDTAAPVVVHTPIKSTAAGAKFVEVFAKVTDESKFFPQVFFRYGPGDYKKPLDMKKVQGQPNVFGAAIPVSGSVVEYYVEAYDEYGNGPGRSADPEHPWRVDTTGGVARVEPPPAKEPIAPPLHKPAPAPVAQASGGRTWTWIAGGAGLGLLTGGLLAGVAVRTADDAYKARLNDQGNNPASLQSQYDANRSLGTKATILTIAGGVLLATSVALYFFEVPSASDGKRSRDDEGGGLRGAVVPLDGGGALALHGSF